MRMFQEKQYGLCSCINCETGKWGGALTGRVQKLQISVYSLGGVQGKGEWEEQ